MNTREIQPKILHRSSGISLLTLLLLFPLFIAAILFLPTSVLIAIGLLPSIAALLIDREPQRYVFLTVGLMNVAGVFPQIVKLWVTGESMDNAMKIISDPLAWLIMYGAATVGWFIFFTVPPTLQTIINQKTKLRIASLDHKQNAMIKEWGEDLRVNPPAERSGQSG